MNGSTPTNQSVPHDSTAGDSTQKSISHDTVFKAVADHYKQDLREFFTRANFYLAIHAALLTTIGIRDVPDSRVDWAVTIIIAFAGVVLACFWGLVSQASVLWIRRWRKEIQQLSREYSPTETYHNIEEEANRHRYQSPEELTKFLPWFFGVVWLALPIALYLAS